VKPSGQAPPEPAAASEGVVPVAGLTLRTDDQELSETKSAKVRTQ
jgi:hypothetical protein